MAPPQGTGTASDSPPARTGASCLAREGPDPQHLPVCVVGGLASYAVGLPGSVLGFGKQTWNLRTSSPCVSAAKT